MPEDSALLTRASIGPKYLTGPAPDREEWQAILRFLENAPCHDDAYPFRVVICEDREALGEVLDAFERDEKYDGHIIIDVDPV